MNIIKYLNVAAGMVLLFAACSEEQTTSPPNGSNSAIVDNLDTLRGDIKGVLKAGRTYYLAGDAFVVKGDTLKAEPGARLLDLTNHTLFVRGALVAEGTATQMVLFSTNAASPIPGAWGGIQCDSPSVVSLKFCRISYAGGVRPDGRPRPAIYYFSNAANTSEFILEDCILDRTQDDGFTLYGGHGRVLRNKFLFNGEIEGSGPNFKTGFTGEVAYNYIWSCVDQSIRVETSATVLYPQTDVLIHNNTIINSGHKNSSRPGAAVKVDFFARARVYNNIFVNTRFGLFVTAAADTNNCQYGNNLFYTTIDSLKGAFYPSEGCARPQASDLLQVDPMFVQYNPDLNALIDDNDVHLQPGSPAIGAGNQTYDADLGCWGRRRDN